MAGDWSTLGYASHPIPGDPGQVDVMSRYYAGVATAINETAANLRQITQTSDVESEAVAAFKELALSVSNSVNEIDARYTVVSGALLTYGNELSRVRASAWQELVAAEQHRTERSAARRRVSILEDQIQDPSTPPANMAYLQSQLYRKQNEVYQADAAISAAISRVQELVEQRATAARNAASLIEDECRGSDLNDSWTDKLADFASELWNGVLDLLEDLVDLIDSILPILDVLAVLVAVVMIVLICTGVGVLVIAIIAVVVAATTLLLNVIKLNAQVVLAANGRVSWAEVAKTAVDVVIAAVGVALSVLGVPTGGASSLVTTGARAVESRVGSEVGEELFEYLVRDRLIDFAGDGAEYVIDGIDTGEAPEFGQVAIDLFTTPGEYLIFDGVRNLVTADDPQPPVRDTAFLDIPAGARTVYEAFGSDVGTLKVCEA